MTGNAAGQWAIRPIACDDGSYFLGRWPYFLLARLELTGAVFSNCTGELVAVQGTMHATEHVGQSGDRSHIHLSTHIKDADAVGAPSGARYILSDSEMEQSNADLDGAPFEMTHIHTIILTRIGEGGSLGRADDLRFHLAVHMTVNSNGTLTADHAEVKDECR